MPKMSMTVKRGERVSKRVTPSTLVRKSKIAKKREALLKMTPEQQAQIMAQVALDNRFLPGLRGTMWSPAPMIPPNIPAVQPYTSKWAKTISKVTGYAASMLAGQYAPMLQPVAAEFGRDWGLQGAQYMGWGISSPTMLRRDHPALYSPSVADVGTPFNPLHKSMEMIVAY